MSDKSAAEALEKDLRDALDVRLSFSQYLNERIVPMGVAEIERVIATLATLRAALAQPQEGEAAQLARELIEWAESGPRDDSEDFDEMLAVRDNTVKVCQASLGYLPERLDLLHAV